ncbi:hypothetical protein PHMEG_00029876 [Phytophthora megakarya]|uniref:Eukaryotic/viral aspartic protease n=1 Tax=Phytophthora megakarya TaxID=4795 RepID=A0A225V219_9STRA|nr:hypothetical protein PHMEG_00029876 [Phytophthora megakarya]
MFNPMVNIIVLKDLTRSSHWLSERAGWKNSKVSRSWEGAKLSSSVRDWRGNLDESVRRSWKCFVKVFREEYCKAKTPDSEYYYTTFQRKSETPRGFYYRLNKITGKADSDIKATDIARDRHLKVFVKKLKDAQLRWTLQGQRVCSLKDLEHILKQHEEIWWSDDREAHPLKVDDRKADGAFGNRKRQKNHNRAYNVNEDEVFASDNEQQVLFDQGVEATPSRGEDRADYDSTSSTEDLVTTGRSVRFEDTEFDHDANDEDDYVDDELEDKAPVQEPDLHEDADVFVTKSVIDDDSRRESTHDEEGWDRPPINGDTPVAYKTLRQCLNAMLDTSSWILLFAPKAA